MNGRCPLKVTLDHPIPVLIVYGTAVVEETGEVHFFDDIYGQKWRWSGVVRHTALIVPSNSTLAGEHRSLLLKSLRTQHDDLDFLCDLFLS
jgi:hypothetical protein